MIYSVSQTMLHGYRVPGSVSNRQPQTFSVHVALVLLFLYRGLRSLFRNGGKTLFFFTVLHRHYVTYQNITQC